MQNPVKLQARALKLWLAGRVHYQSHPVDGTRHVDGEAFHPFRRVVLDPADAGTSPGAIFQVRFHFKNLPMWMNRFLSLIPVPMILAQPGFRSKTWQLGQDSDDFIGYYEFDTVEQAEAYWDSLPLRMMRRRASPGSLTRTITPHP